MASESDEITYYRLYVSDAALRDIEAIYAFLLENADELAVACPVVSHESRAVLEHCLRRLL